MFVVVDAPLSDDALRESRALFPSVTFTAAPRDGNPIPRDLLAQAEVIYTESANFDPAHAPRLRWVQTTSASTQAVWGKPIMQTAIPVANVSGAYSVAVAECALAMLLALTRRITRGVRWQLERRWAEDYLPWAGVDLYGLTMGIVGYGSIGRQIGRLALGLGMTVLACKRRPDSHEDDSYLLPGTGDPHGKIPRAWFGLDHLHEMLRQCDVVVLALPGIPTTTRLFGAAEIAAMRQAAWLVNVGRGSVVDENALVEALRAGRLAGTALDVFTQEPLPPESPFWTLENVLVMPHIASWTKLQAHRAAGVLQENLRRDLAGEPILNVIDKDLLY